MFAHTQSLQILFLKCDDGRSGFHRIQTGIDPLIIHFDIDKLTQAGIDMEAQFAAVFLGPLAVSAFNKGIFYLLISTDITKVVRTIIVVSLATCQDLSAIGCLTLFPVSHGIMFPLIAVFRRNVTSLRMTTYGTLSFFTSGNSTGSLSHHSPLTVGMIFGLCRMIAGTYGALSPVTFVIVLIANIGMGMLFACMLFFPVIFPITAANTGAMFATGLRTIGSTAILTETALFTDHTTLGAHLSAFLTDFSTVFTGFTSFT